MSDVLSRLAQAEIVYDWWRGPQEVRSIEDAVANGANCVALAHLAIGTAVLSPKLHCFEMVGDRQRFETVKDLNDLRPADLFWFGQDVPEDVLAAFEPQYNQDQWLLNWQDNPVNHVAIFTGYRDHGGEPLLLHASPEDGRNAIWPLAKFAQYPRYKKLWRVSRFAGERSMVSN